MTDWSWCSRVDRRALMHSVQLKELKIPTDANRVIEEELEKMTTLEKNSSEFNVTRTYLDWLTSVPWGRNSVENFDVACARGVLDEDHFGMKVLVCTA